MGYLNVFVVAATLLLCDVALESLSAPAAAQTQNSAQEKAASLRAQLSELETKQADLQTRLKWLDESLKPENIENSLAGVGSTHPEDLRAQQRRQLEIERKGVQAQLDLLAASHTRLETAISRADADAYHQSAAPVNVTSTNIQSITSTSPTSAESSSVTTSPKRPRRVRRRRARSVRR
jgi:prefoldin subunit 5